MARRTWLRCTCGAKVHKKSDRTQCYPCVIRARKNERKGVKVSKR